MTPLAVETFISSGFDGMPKNAVFPHVLPLKEGDWLGAESNRRHVDFQSTALPTELPSRKIDNRTPKPGVHYARFRLQGKSAVTLSRRSTTVAHFRRSQSVATGTFVATRRRGLTAANNALLKSQSRRTVANAA